MVELIGFQAGMAEGGDRVVVYGLMGQSYIGKTTEDTKCVYSMKSHYTCGFLNTRNLLVKGVADPEGLYEGEELFTSNELGFIREIYVDSCRFALISASIAPQIIGRPLIKAALALVLFGGKTKMGGNRTDQIHMGIEFACFVMLVRIIIPLRKIPGVERGYF